MDMMNSNTTSYAVLEKVLPNFIGIFLSGLCMTFLMAYIFNRWAGISTLARGFAGGMIISFPIILSWNISYYSFYNLYSTTWLATDVVISTLFYGIIGAIEGWILGMGKKPA